MAELVLSHCTTDNPDAVLWAVYILQCADGTLYTGITNHLTARIAAHEKGKGAKYTKGRGPFKLACFESYPTKSAALKREAKIKSLSRKQKLKLCHLR